MKFKFKFLQNIAADQTMWVSFGVIIAKAIVLVPKDFDIIGVIRFGMEFGLLARTDSGNYIRINGSEIQRLRKQTVEEAILVAKLNRHNEPTFTPEFEDTTLFKPRSPIVVQKKRRRIDPHLITMNVEQN